MSISQIENEIRRLPQKEQLELLSWLAEYIRHHIFPPEFGATTEQEDITLDDIEHPLQGTLLKFEQPLESVAVEDWDVLQ